MRLILASQSRIRKKALDILSLNYEILPSYIDEKAIRNPDPIKLAQQLSESKAQAVGEREAALIIAGDAFLVFEGTILEKPRDLKEAADMLHALSGKNYTFVTGLAVYNSITKKLHSCVETSEIYWRTLSDEEITHYIGHNSVLHYAGAHNTDGVIRFAEKIVGNNNFFTAIPMNKLIEFLRYNTIAV